MREREREREGDPQWNPQWREDENRKEGQGKKWMAYVLTLGFTNNGFSPRVFFYEEEATNCARSHRPRPIELSHTPKHTHRERERERERRKETFITIYDPPPPIRSHAYLLRKLMRKMTMMPEMSTREFPSLSGGISCLKGWNTGSVMDLARPTTGSSSGGRLGNQDVRILTSTAT